MELKLNREFAMRHLGVAILFAALTCWFGYDGLVRYPSLSAHDIYVSIEKSEPGEGADLEAFKQQKIKTQHGFALLCLLASAVVALGVLRNKRRTLAWDDKEMCGTLTGGRPLAFSDIVGVEDVQWARKGIIVFLAKDGRRVKLDAWHHAGVEELVAKVLPSKSNENESQEN